MLEGARNREAGDAAASPSRLAARHAARLRHARPGGKARLLCPRLQQGRLRDRQGRAALRDHQGPGRGGRRPARRPPHQAAGGCREAGAAVPRHARLVPRAGRPHRRRRHGAGAGRPGGGARHGTRGRGRRQRGRPAAARPALRPRRAGAAGARPAADPAGGDAGAALDPADPGERQGSSPPRSRASSPIPFRSGASNWPRRWRSRPCGRPGAP